MSLSELLQMSLSELLGFKKKDPPPNFHYFHYERAPHTKETREEALKYWQSRVERHSKPDGCSGCLDEAKKELQLWETA